MQSRFGNAFCLDFSQDFQILFSPGQFKKNHEKKPFVKKEDSVKILGRF